ncbi:pentapeptide repeat-containing protein [Lentzea sp. NPDC054927]
MKAKKPMSPWTMPLVSAAILLLTGAVLVALWLWVNRQTWTDPEKRTAAQLDVVKVASGIALGGGGLFTLYLAARRQRTQEEAQADVNADAEARRITELYSKAVQQLGDAKVPVRLGGLYALERLGQQEPETRRTIVNVLCAYLRMPYTQPSEKAEGLANGVFRPLVRSPQRRAGIRQPDGPSAVAALVEARLELDVRLTAQRILIAHLEQGDPEYWGEHDIDLTGAVLINFFMYKCRLGAGKFNGTSFRGDTTVSAGFTGLASFYGASFEDRADFGMSSFESGAAFGETSFGGEVSFRDASFSGLPAMFTGTSFGASASFAGASFAEMTWFSDVTFNGEVTCDDVWVERNKDTSRWTWPDGWELSATPVSRPDHDGEWFQLVRTSSAAPPRPPNPES